MYSLDATISGINANIETIAYWMRKSGDDIISLFGIIKCEMSYSTDKEVCVYLSSRKWQRIMLILSNGDLDAPLIPDFLTIHI